MVCSVEEARAVRRRLGRNFMIVTPGIRPAGASKEDQKRIATPEAARQAGADFIVVGRPILKARDPLKAVAQLVHSAASKPLP